MERGFVLARSVEWVRELTISFKQWKSTIGKEKKLFKGPLGSKKLNENQNIDTSQIGFSYDQPTFSRIVRQKLMNNASIEFR